MQRKTTEAEDVVQTILLVPELCNLTGLTDTMRADFKVMKDVAQFTRVTPTQRQEVSSRCFCLAFCSFLFFTQLIERNLQNFFLLGSL